MRFSIFRAGQVSALIVAGLTTYGASLSSAQAGKFGGNCCADLEERVAELEATTVRKGNRKVSLEVTGQINKYMMFWDDGVESNAYILDNATSSSRFSFSGSAPMTADLSAGFIMEFELVQSASDRVDQGDTDGGTNLLELRKAAWSVRSRQYGNITVGRYSPATDDVILINYGATGVTASADTRAWNGGFFLRNSANGNTWDHVLSGGLGLDTERGDVVRYDSPTLAGFVLSAAWGDDDIWDIALKWTGAHGNFRIAAGIGYLNNDGTELTINGVDRSVSYSEIKGSSSVMHVPSGLYLTGAYLGRERDVVSGGGLPDSRMYYVQAGIKKRVLGIGATTLFTEFSNNEDFGTGVDFDGSGARDYISSKVDVWGIGLVQRVDSAGMEVYAVYRNYDGELLDNSSSLTEDDFSSVAIGARIKF